MNLRILRQLSRLAGRIPLAVVVLLSPWAGFTADAPNDDDLKRQQAIAGFTRKMKEANYPALFDKAAAEFNVPPDVLKGVAFTLTRWEHLQWPAGENFSPENGMPRPYGIMSLWSNDFFGMSLLEAAKLIGKDPEELKADPFQNMRGGAALLRKKYDENPKPAGTTEPDIESWRYAIADYTGIPERDLKQRAGLEVYEHMNKGYHQYGIEWAAHPVNLAPMRAEVKQIVAEENRKREERMKLAGAPPPAAPVNSSVSPDGKAPPVTQPKIENSAPPSAQLATATPAQNSDADKSGMWWLVGVLVLLLGGSVLALIRRRSRGTTD